MVLKQLYHPHNQYKKDVQSWGELRARRSCMSNILILLLCWISKNLGKCEKCSLTRFLFFYVHASHAVVDGMLEKLE